MEILNRESRRTRIELAVFLCGAVVVYVLSRFLDLAELIFRFSHAHEKYEIDEILTLIVYLAVVATILMHRRWREEKQLSAELRAKSQELQRANRDIAELQEILPICAGCKKIRDDEGYWHHVESYIQNRTGTSFSHGLCPECVKRLYPDIEDA